MSGTPALHPEIKTSRRHAEGIPAEERGCGFILYLLAYAKKGHRKLLLFLMVIRFIARVDLRPICRAYELLEDE